MDTILKVEHNGDLRRALLKGVPDFAAVDRAVQEIWPGQSAQQTKYEDDEGDLCTLAAATFHDFLGTMKKTGKSQVLRLQLVPRSDSSRSSTATAAEKSDAAEAFSSPWQHVEQGTEGDLEGPHTVVDLTDVQETQQDCPPSEAAAGLTCPVSANGEKQESVTVEVRSEQPACPTYAIDTPKGKPADDAKTVLAAVSNDMHESTSKDADTVETYADHLVEDKVDIIIAAFDENADGHLDFEEVQVLYRIAEGRRISVNDFQQTCAAWCEDPSVGLGRKALLSIYGKAGPLDPALDQHFIAATQKLQGLELTPQQPQVAAPRQSPVPRQCNESSYLFPGSELLLGEVASARKRFEGLSNKVCSGIATRSYRPKSCLGSKLKALF